ncbi:MAG: T9SS type A sorting domain-containing protein [Flavipsychrobacter sp.]
MKFKTLLTMATCMALGMQANAQMRLVADAHYRYAGTTYNLMDSNKYEHSSNGYATAQFNIPVFDNQFDMGYLYKVVSGNATLSERTTTTFSSNNIDMSTTDTTSDGGTTWKGKRRVKINYVSGKPDTVFYANWSNFGSGSWFTNRKTAYVFTGNNITSETSQRYVFGMGAGWRNDYRNTYSYSGANKVTSLIHEEWNNSSKIWENKTKAETSYNGSNQPLVVNNYNWDGSAWVINDRDNYTYNAGKLESIASEFYFSGTWTGSYKNTYYGTGAHPDSMIRQSWDQINKFYINNIKYYYKHNGAGQVTELRTETWDGIGSFKPTSNADSMNRYYYWWPTNVATNTVVEKALMVYPSPANNLVSIKLSGDVYGKPVRFTVTDMSGRIVKSWSGISSPKMSVSVADLPTGSYILTANNAEDIQSQRFSVEK